MPSVRERVIAEALTWRGTPYHHQMSLRGVGCDCLGLVRGVWRGVYGTEPELPPAYSADWGEASRRERLYEAAKRNLIEIDLDARLPGDVLLFRMLPGAPAKHAGILIEPARFLHAYSGRAVAAHAFSPWWESKLAAVFTWPEL